MKPVVKIISLIFILMLLIACQHEESDSVVDIQKLVIPVLTESTTLVVGESKKLNIFATKVDNSQEDVTS
ncbi:MAG: hypothetical protein OEX19_14805, partial [Gammaproteobacteria bacterium]|nr:hypothetical protein [Gammaproteobacteria bacterium]